MGGRYKYGSPVLCVSKGGFRGLRAVREYAIVKKQRSVGVQKRACEIAGNTHDWRAADKISLWQKHYSPSVKPPASLPPSFCPASNIAAS